MKPLGMKAYGSIPHLPGSRMGPADHHCHEGQLAIACVKPRDRHDRIIVTEKLDGACVSIAKKDGLVLALGRAGYLASSAPFEHIIRFGQWVEQNAARFADLPDGTRIVGEWLAMAHGTIYELQHEPFVAFDFFDGKHRVPHDDARSIFAAFDLPAAHVVSDGPSISVGRALDLLGPHGHHGSKEPVEGAVWRVERSGRFDFLAKWVRPDKIDGKYLPDVSGEPAIWLWGAP